MRELRELKDDKGLSILIIARTPSRATMRGTVTLADLEGSAEITGYADNIFAIGGSCADPSLRYLKQIKLRSCESEFDETNVPTFRIEKREGNFLSFRHVDFEDERYLVLNSRYSYDAGLLATIEMLSDQGRSQREIADELRVSKTTVNRYLMIVGRQREERERLEYEEEQKRLKRQKPLTPGQERDRRLFEAASRQHQENLRRKAAEAVALGLPPPPTVSLRDCEPMTPSSVFSRPDPLDDKCDCFHCGSGRPKYCLEKMAITSRSP
jgi:predicted transcriptional regulator